MTGSKASLGFGVDPSAHGLSVPTDMLLPSTSGPLQASDPRAEDPARHTGLVRPDWR